MVFLFMHSFITGRFKWRYFTSSNPKQLSDCAKSLKYKNLMAYVIKEDLTFLFRDLSSSSAFCIKLCSCTITHGSGSDEDKQWFQCKTTSKFTPHPFQPWLESFYSSGSNTLLELKKATQDLYLMGLGQFWGFHLETKVHFICVINQICLIMIPKESSSPLVSGYLDFLVKTSCNSVFRMRWEHNVLICLKFKLILL